MTDEGDPEVERQAYLVQPVSSLVEKNTLTVRETDTAEALVAGGGKRSERGTLIQEGAQEARDVPHDPLPDGPRYAAMGDAVTVSVLEWLGVRVLGRLRAEGEYEGAVGFEEVLERDGSFR